MLNQFVRITSNEKGLRQKYVISIKINAFYSFDYDDLYDFASCLLQRQFNESKCITEPYVFVCVHV